MLLLIFLSAKDKMDFMTRANDILKQEYSRQLWNFSGSSNRRVSFDPPPPQPTKREGSDNNNQHLEMFDVTWWCSFFDWIDQTFVWMNDVTGAGARCHLEKPESVQLQVIQKSTALHRNQRNRSKLENSPEPHFGQFWTVAYDFGQFIFSSCDFILLMGEVSFFTTYRGTFVVCGGFGRKIWWAFD